MPVRVAHSDARAAELHLAYYERFFNGGAMDGPRYWIVHGPGGHVVGVK